MKQEEHIRVIVIEWTCSCDDVNPNFDSLFQPVIDS